VIVNDTVPLGSINDAIHDLNGGRVAGRLVIVP
jgi:hypothetical protein